MSRGRRRSDDDAAMGCLIYLMLILFFMPIAGLYLVCSKGNTDKKALGWVLLIVGIILWIIVGVKSA